MCRVEASGRQNSQGDIVPSPPNANLQQVEHEEAEQQQRELPGAQPDVRAEHHRRHSEAQHQLAHATGGCAGEANFSARGPGKSNGPSQYTVPLWLGQSYLIYL